MTRFVTELHTRPEMPVKGAANSRLGKRLVSIFSVAKPSTNQVSDESMETSLSNSLSSLTRQRASNQPTHEINSSNRLAKNTFFVHPSLVRLNHVHDHHLNECTVCSLKMNSVCVAPSPKTRRSSDGRDTRYSSPSHNLVFNFSTVTVCFIPLYINISLYITASR